MGGKRSRLWDVQHAPDTYPKEWTTQDEAERQVMYRFQASVHAGLGRRGWIIGKHEAALGPMRINGEDDPLHDVTSWCERLWETHAYLARGPWSRKPALVHALPGLHFAGRRIQDNTKDFNAAELSLDGFVKPEPYRAGRLGDHCLSGRQRAHQDGMRWEKCWERQEQATQPTYQ